MRFPTRLTLSAVATIALVLGVVTPVAAEEAEAPPAEQQLLPVVESTPADAVTPTVPEGVFEPGIVTEHSPRQLAGHDDGPIDFSALDLDELEVVSRDEFSTVYELPNGAQGALLGEAPVNVRRDGAWGSDPDGSGAHGRWVGGG